jgi:hypothetical protein
MLLADAPRFLTLEGLQAEIAKYYYREGWSLEVFADPWEGPCLYVVADVPDAYHPGETVRRVLRDLARLADSVDRVPRSP